MSERGKEGSVNITKEIAKKHKRLRAYGAMETHQTSNLRIAGSIPAMLVFLMRMKGYKDRR